MAKYKYSWANETENGVRGGKTSQADAQEVGEWYYSLPSRDPEHVLKEAKKRDCPIHNLFEWDDSKAAFRQRSYVLANIVGSLRIEIVNKQNKKESIRAFIKSVETGFNVPIVEATEDDLTAAEEKCLYQMNQFRDRWKNFKIAKNVISEIDRVRASRARRSRIGMKSVRS